MEHYRDMSFREKSYYIANINNIASILERGILSFNECLASKVRHTSFALPTVQSRRDRITIPNGLPLHDYACTYLDARNSAMFFLSRKHPHFKQLCVLVLDGQALITIDGAVVSDVNAASGLAHFYPASEVNRLDLAKIYARSWNHPDQQDKWLHSHQKCAELLIPHRIDPVHILGVYVQDEDAKVQLKNVVPAIKSRVHPDVFFG